MERKARKAAILGEVSPEVLVWLRAHCSTPDPNHLADGFIDLLEIDEAAKPIIAQLLVPFALLPEDGAPLVKVSAHVTPSVGIHADELVLPYTVGVVLEGDHWLHLLQQLVGPLRAGTVYFLDNHSLHGARRASLDAPPLRFVSVDFAAYDLRDAMDRVGAQPLHERGFVTADRQDAIAAESGRGLLREMAPIEARDRVLSEELLVERRDAVAREG